MHKTSTKIFPLLVNLYENVLSDIQIKDVFNFLISLDGNLLTEGTKGKVKSSSSTTKFVDIISEIKLNVPSCNNIFDIFNNCLREYEYECGLHKLFITNSWFNIQNLDSSLEYHTHCGSIISGAFYVNVDDQSSRFFMMSPNNRNLYINSVKHRTEYNVDKLCLKPKNNSLVLFPSWIFHGSDSDFNQTKDRTVISFNTLVSHIN